MIYLNNHFITELITDDSAVCYVIDVIKILLLKTNIASVCFQMVNTVVDSFNIFKYTMPSLCRCEKKCNYYILYFTL